MFSQLKAYAFIYLHGTLHIAASSPYYGLLIGRLHWTIASFLNKDGNRYLIIEAAHNNNMSQIYTWTVSYPRLWNIFVAFFFLSNILTKDVFFEYLYEVNVFIRKHFIF